MGEPLPHNRQFRAVRRRLGVGLAAAGCLAAAAASPGCSRQGDALSRQEQLLVDDLLAQARATLSAAGEDSTETSPPVPQGTGDSTRTPVTPPVAPLAPPRTAWLDSTSFEEQLAGSWARLWTNPERGRRVLQAVHDSLQALRPTLFPPPPKPSEPPPGQTVAQPHVP